MKYFYIILIVTFTLFFLEALIHFNLGINNGSTLNPKKSHTKIGLDGLGFIHIPDLEETAYIGFVVIIFSLLNSYITTHFMEK